MQSNSPQIPVYVCMANGKFVRYQKAIWAIYNKLLLLFSFGPYIMFSALISATGEQ
jgi:hypothetical protein